jgi:hypothetical protein
MAAGRVRLPTIISLYLDVLVQDIGAIQIIPHSHKYGNQYAESLHEQIRDSDQNKLQFTMHNLTSNR